MFHQPSSIRFYRQLAEFSRVFEETGSHVRKYADLLKGRATKSSGCGEIRIAHRRPSFWSKHAGVALLFLRDLPFLLDWRLFLYHWL